MIEGLVDVLIINWNGYELTRSCILSLQCLEYAPIRIVMVDNHSSDDSVRRLKQEFGELIILEADDNLGFTGGNNFGLEWILKDGSSEYTLLLNNDTEVESNFLGYLVDDLRRDQYLGQVSPLIYFRYPQTPLKIWAVGGKVDFWKGKFRSHLQGKGNVEIHSLGNYHEPDYLTGCCFLAKNSLIKSIGLLDDDYFAYYEDTEYSHRMRQAGYKLLVDSRSIIYHVAGASSKNQSGGLSPFIWYLNVRNQFWFIRQYANIFQKVIYLPQRLCFLFVLLFYFLFKGSRSKSRALVFGILDGLILRKRSHGNPIKRIA